MSESCKVFTESCYARIGLMGNPSDGFGGKTLSLLIKNFSAIVTITEVDNSSSTGSFEIIANEVHDKFKFNSIDEYYDHAFIYGYYGGVRLIQATCKVFMQYCRKNKHAHNKVILKQSRHIQVSYDTNIPRMVGLSGSSAIVVATFKLLMKYYDITLDDLYIQPEEFPQVILNIETNELHISAGLQDRVIQTYGGLVHMDFSVIGSIDSTTKTIRNTGIYTSLDPRLLPPLYLAYNLNAAGESGKVHSTVKERWAQQDPQLIQGMKDLAHLADLARDSLLLHNYTQLAQYMNQNFSIRRQLYGDDVIGNSNLQAMHIASQYQLAAKFTGSGGAIVCLRQDTPTWLSPEVEVEVIIAFANINFHFIRVEIPST